MAVLGLDTSNYTTSLAVFDGHDGINVGRLLLVRPGELGLRQSDALFQHVRQLPVLFRELERQGLLAGLTAVGASTRPREVEGSYMPCFLAGCLSGRGAGQYHGASFLPLLPPAGPSGGCGLVRWAAGTAGRSLPGLALVRRDYRVALCGAGGDQCPCPGHRREQ